MGTMVDRQHDHGARWLAAVDLAQFVPYEPVGDSIEAIWASGFGGPPGGTGHIEISARRDGVELSVDTTATPPHPDPNVRLSMLVQGLIGRHTLGQAELKLPFTVTVDRDDRDILVSGRSTTFSGARVIGSTHWIGEAAVDELVVRVELDGAVDFELRPCSDLSALPTAPPGERLP